MPLYVCFLRIISFRVKVWVTFYPMTSFILRVEVNSLLLRRCAYSAVLINFDISPVYTAQTNPGSTRLKLTRVSFSLEKCRVNTNLGRTRVSFDFAHAHSCVLWSCDANGNENLQNNRLDY